MTNSEREIIDLSRKAMHDLMEALLANAERRLDMFLSKLDRMQNRQTQQWFTVRETAEALGKSAYTVREYVKAGKLEARRNPDGAGGKGELRISQDAINRFREPRDGRDGDSDVPAKLNPLKSSGNGHVMRG